jgi:1-acyl-sn-glycerol-3-phosphate acyltransferase
MPITPAAVTDPPIAPLTDAVPRRGSAFSAWLGRTVLRLMGWRFTGTFADEPRVVMIGAPHTTNWDFVVALSAAFSVRLGFSWVGKHVLFRWPAGIFFRYMGGIPVDRRRPQGFVQQMADEFAARRQFWLAIAPEGTRKTVQRWKTGFYHIAVAAGVPIQLVFFDYPRKNLHMGPVLWPSGDLDADLERILALFAERLGRPLLPS